MRRKSAAVILSSIMIIAALSGCRGGAPGNPAQKDGQTVEANRSEAEQSELKRLAIFENLKAMSFSGEAAEDGFIAGEAGIPQVLVYWASFCPTCKDGLHSIDSLSENVSANGGELVLINKLDGVKETREKAVACLSEAGVKTTNYFDDDCKNYDSLKLTMIPTVLVTDASGILTSFCEGEIPDENVLLSMLNEAKRGKSAGLAEAVNNTLDNGSGGIMTTYLDEGGETPSGSDVLSESQGLMMLYAARLSDKTRFDRLWGYTRGMLIDDKLPMWVKTREKASPVSAAVDDFRIYRAISEAGIAPAELEKYAAALLEYDTDGENLTDFYDFSAGERAARLTLCYADFAAMKRLTQSDPKWEKIYENALYIVEKGVISEKNPLYYPWYDYQTKSYQGESLHISEALVTLLNLSREGKLPVAALNWLRERIIGDGYLYARYTMNGEPHKDGLYETTAGYALVARIAVSEGDIPLARAALTRMETLRYRNAGSILDGVFGGGDGRGVYSFDQLNALLAYQEMEEHYS